MISGISKVKIEEGVFEVKDFRDFTEECFFCYAKENSVISSPAIIYSGGKLLGGLNPIKIYNVYGELAVYCNNGYIYFPNRERNKKFEISPVYQVPKIFPINYEGKKSVVITAEHGGYVINDTFSYLGIPKAEHYAVYLGTLFCAEGRKIIVCKSKDQTGYNVDVYKDFSLIIDAGLGSVKKLIPTDNGLYVFCLRGIAIIKSSSDGLGFHLEKPNFPPIKVVEGSIAKVKDKIYFLSNDGLYSFNGERFEKIKSLLEGKNYAIVGEAVSKDETYLLSIIKEGNPKIYCYDQGENADTFINSITSFLAEDGVTYNVREGRGDLIKDVSTVREWHSVKMDFNNSNEKTLCGVYINTATKTHITLCSKGCEKNFTVNAGKNYIPISLTAKEFWIKVKSETRINLRELKFKYRVKGDKL